MRTLAFCLIVCAVIVWLAIKDQQRRARERRAQAEWSRLIVSAPEPEHVTVYRYQPPAFAYDWQRCRDLRVPMPVGTAGEHAA